MQLVFSSFVLVTFFWSAVQVCRLRSAMQGSSSRTGGSPIFVLTFWLEMRSHFWGHSCSGFCGWDNQAFQTGFWLNPCVRECTRAHEHQGSHSTHVIVHDSYIRVPCVLFAGVFHVHVRKHHKTHFETACLSSHPDHHHSAVPYA